MNGVKNEELKHSCAHLLAHAVKELYPEVKLGFGPPLEEGFYYDFGSSHFAEDDLKKIEERMRDIVKRNYPIEKSEITRVQAKMIFKNEPFKIEHLDELKEKIYSASKSIPDIMLFGINGHSGGDGISSGGERIGPNDGDMGRILQGLHPNASIYFASCLDRKFADGMARLAGGRKVFSADGIMRSTGVSIESLVPFDIKFYDGTRRDITIIGQK